MIVTEIPCLFLFVLLSSNPLRSWNGHRSFIIKVPNLSPSTQDPGLKYSWHVSQDRYVRGQNLDLGLDVPFIRRVESLRIQDFNS